MPAMVGASVPLVNDVFLITGRIARAKSNAAKRLRSRIFERQVMPKQFSSALRNNECDSRSAHNLTLVEPTRGLDRIALRVEALTKRYGKREALTAASFDVREGEVFGLLGRNGAGKTTMISILATERLPTSGDALVLGHSIREEQRAVRQLIGVAPQEIALYPMLTGIENLRFFGRIYGLRGTQLSRVEQLLRFVGLQERGSDRVMSYSIGMRRRLNLAVALVHRPKLILLDEPTAGVDPQSREDILQLVRRLRDEGSAILYTTHHIDEAEALCDRLCILNRGKVVTVGTLDKLVHKVDCSEVIELRGVSARSDLSSIRTLAGVHHVERTDGVVRLFVKRAADFLEPLQEILSRDRAVRLRIAPISLESLFLRLTGPEVHE
jgi:ABC-2 type transport system ATP-binding protein